MKLKSVKRMRKASGSFRSKEKLVGFLYVLMRDHVTAGIIEELMEGVSNKDCLYTNGWLAQYAEDVANRLK